MITTALEKGTSQRLNTLPSGWTSVNKFFKNNFLRSRNINTLEAIPSIDMKEENNNYVLDLFAPGFRKEDFDITIKGDLLNISYKNSYFSRAVTLPEYADSKNMEIKYNDEALNLIIPKKAA